MVFADPVPGLVIRYSYLWRDEHARGLVEGGKDRPWAVLLATAGAAGEKTVLVLPITHVRPRNQIHGVEIPPATKRRLGLDDEQSWIVLTEANKPLKDNDKGAKEECSFLKKRAKKLL